MRGGRGVPALPARSSRRNQAWRTGSHDKLPTAGRWTHVRLGSRHQRGDTPSVPAWLQDDPGTRSMNDAGAGASDMETIADRMRDGVPAEECGVVRGAT